MCASDSASKDLRLSAAEIVLKLPELSALLLLSVTSDNAQAIPGANKLQVQKANTCNCESSRKPKV